MCESLEFAGMEVVQRWHDTGIPKKELLVIIKNFDAMIVGRHDKIDSDVIRAGKKLKILAQFGVGTDNIDVPAATKAGIVVANTPGANTNSVAELAVCLMIAVARQVIESSNFVKSGSIYPQVGPELENKTVGIIGLGNIGKSVATRLAGFGMKIIVNDIVPYPEWKHWFPIEYVEKEYIYKNADFITIHTPLTELTKNMIGERELKTMKKSTILINTARGGIVNEEALDKALSQGWIFGAGLDVYSIEPPVGINMIKHKNFLGTTHIGACTYGSIQRMGEMASINVIRVLNGKKPINAINPETTKNLMYFNETD
jgi:D-3-phosphoglycerate dehydrogenase